MGGREGGTEGAKGEKREEARREKHVLILFFHIAFFTCKDFFDEIGYLP